MYGCPPGLWLLPWWSTFEWKWQSREPYPALRCMSTGWEVTSYNLRNSSVVSGKMLYRCSATGTGARSGLLEDLHSSRSSWVMPWTAWSNWPALRRQLDLRPLELPSNSVTLGIDDAFKSMKTSVTKCGSLGEEHFMLSRSNQFTSKHLEKLKLQYPCDIFLLF